MNIACDARSLVGRHTGVATWVGHIMGGLARDRNRTVTLAASKPIDLPEVLRHQNVRVLAPPRLPIPGTLWLHTVLPAEMRRAGVDVFVGSLAVLPRRCPIPAVSMIHDITPRTHPRHHTLANRFCFNAYLEESLDWAAVVVTGSAATEHELLTHFHSVRSKLVRIGYGVDDFFSPAPEGDDGSATRNSLTSGRRYLLHLGTLEPRKGVTDLVSAWEELWDTHPDPPDLVLAGGPGWGMQPIMARIDDSPHRDHIHLPGYVDRETARDLLRFADVFVIASQAEGFGLPLAEAVSCGTPCVASDIPSLREAGGGAALYSAPCAPAELSRNIVAALDPDTADDLRQRAAVRAAELGWAPVVAAWDDLLERVVEESRNK